MLRSPRPAHHRIPLASGRLRRAQALGLAACCLALPCAALAQPAQQPPGPAAQPAPTAPTAPAAPPAPPGAAPAPQPGQGGLAAPPPAPPGYPQTYPGYGAYPYYPPGYYYPPPPPQAPPPRLRRNNPGMMTGGIALTFAGAAGFIVSGILSAVGNGRYEIYCTDGGGFSGGYPCSQRDDEGLLTAGWITMGVSAVAMGVGIPLWVIGGKRVPVTDKDSEAPKAALRPTVSVGAGSAKLRLSF